MQISEISIGTLLEIYIRRDGYNYKVVSKVEYVDESRVCVSPIASRRHLFRFRPSDLVDIVYRKDDKSWKWERVRASIVKNEEGNMLHSFEPVSKAEVFNRRSTYRLNINREIILRYEVALEKSPVNLKKNMTPELTLDAALGEISTGYTEEECRAFIKDISEGGAMISTDTEFKKGDVVSFRLSFEDEPVICKALVVRARNSAKDFYKFNYGLSYIETSKNYNSYFYSEQRKMLSRNKEDFMQWENE